MNSSNGSFDNEEKQPLTACKTVIIDEKAMEIYKLNHINTIIAFLSERLKSCSDDEPWEKPNDYQIHDYNLNHVVWRSTSYLTFLPSNCKILYDPDDIPINCLLYKDELEDLIKNKKVSKNRQLKKIHDLNQAISKKI